MVHQPIPHTRLADNAMLRVINMKCVVRPMPIALTRQLVMKLKHIVLKIPFKTLHILFPSLSPLELIPTLKQMSGTYYFSKCLMDTPHTNNNDKEIPIVQKLYDLYKTFYGYSLLFPKKDKYTLGAKCEHYIIGTLEFMLAASSVPQSEKLALLRQANVKFDTLKVLLRLSREIGAIDAKKYIVLQTQIREIGRMIGGWQRSLAEAAKA
ncbi:hypothetical protein A3E96_04110 [Candidatus Uhrbacteria bacterium RIFCSPHIGHO2_12_FULL_46_13]|uniref:bAvd-like domain-containing protein n=1 Tax=Candidatus Uhrbacteria bacterium RIFCSPLOWO2_01_FULL_47_25 TaxID=1802402 RepID=A0A1F7UTJ4_9BACT|nr:MAG: hypothetical protein A3E96_04110 [Candidatus Uhrbacteria bacterium RIFCSPHIGHO2_12_FULL_46_13]OGL81611.1 MAG: hypothetical protein A2936_04455 [Candidatus Uhrbacteria bacterium RIFCSPLOWO2_01_FULL_47_25]